VQVGRKEIADSILIQFEVYINLIPQCGKQIDGQVLGFTTWLCLATEKYLLQKILLPKQNDCYAKITNYITDSG
jgi:hypothetical protein